MLTDQWRRVKINTRGPTRTGKKLTDSSRKLMRMEQSLGEQIKTDMKEDLLLILRNEIARMRMISDLKLKLHQECEQKYRTQLVSNESHTTFP